MLLILVEWLWPVKSRRSITRQVPQACHDVVDAVDAMPAPLGWDAAAARPALPLTCARRAVRSSAALPEEPGQTDITTRKPSPVGRFQPSLPACAKCRRWHFRVRNTG
jgi:hypothetical protein